MGPQVSPWVINQVHSICVSTLVPWFRVLVAVLNACMMTGLVVHGGEGRWFNACRITVGRPIVHKTHQWLGGSWWWQVVDEWDDCVEAKCPEQTEHKLFR